MIRKLLQRAFDIRLIRPLCINSSSSNVSNSIAGQKSDAMTSSPQFYHVDENKPFRTTVTCLQDQENIADYLCIYSYNKYGFRLTNSAFVVGPMVLIGHAALSWKVATIDEITENSLALLTVLSPKPDIVVMGVGEEENVSIVQKRLQRFFDRYKLSVEVLCTPDACPLINYLNEDNRFAVAMLFPVHDLPKRGFSVLDSNIERFLSREEDEDLFAFMAGVRAKSLPAAYRDLVEERKQELMEQKEIANRMKKND